MTTDACPKCGGTSGYSYELTETHRFANLWGSDKMANPDSGYKVHVSLVTCYDCKMKFRLDNLERLGVIRR